VPVPIMPGPMRVPACAGVTLGTSAHKAAIATIIPARGHALLCLPTGREYL